MRGKEQIHMLLSEIQWSQCTVAEMENRCYNPAWEQGPDFIIIGQISLF